jgi:hypothetical protein
MLFQCPVEFLTAVTRKSLTVWSRLSDHRKLRELPSKTVFGLLEFRPIRVWKLKIRSATILSRNRI